MRASAPYRPEILLLAALMALAAVATWRGLQPQAGPVAVDMVAPAPAPVGLEDTAAIARLQERLRRAPGDADAAALLGLALLQRARATGDPGLYGPAEEALEVALRGEEHHLDAMLGRAMLALARHQFAEALDWGERARAVAPGRAAVYGVLVDAQVELGRYDEAVAAAQRMVDIRPDLDSYSRVAYLRELHGDVAGAIEAMGLAAEAGAPGAEDTAWALVQLGNLHLGRGELASAEDAYTRALLGRPGYAHAEAGLGRILVARGRPAEAAELYEQVVARLPAPEHAIYLGELYAALGRAEDAERMRELVRAMQRLSAAAGVDVDLELALFEADHGANPAGLVERAAAAYTRRPSLVAADALAWARFKAGDLPGALADSQAALRLGTRDPALRLRAGLIAAAAEEGAAAREHLTIALAGAPALTPAQAAAGRAALAALPAAEGASDG